MKYKPPYPETFIAALNAPKGIKVSMINKGWAHHCSQYLYKERIKARNKSMKIYPPEHPAYNTTPFDNISIMIRSSEDESKWWLEFRNVVGDLSDFTIEEL